MIRAATLVGTLLLIAGCATPPPRPPPDLAGRLVVHVEAQPGGPARSMSTQFELRGDAQVGELVLTTPLGSTAAQAHWRSGSAELVTSDGTRSFSDLDALAQELLGEPLPLAALIDWLRGRPWLGAPSLPVEAGFEQLGWRVDLARFADGWVQARRDRAPAVAVRVRLERPE